MIYGSAEGILYKEEVIRLYMMTLYQKILTKLKGGRSYVRKKKTKTFYETIHYISFYLYDNG